tara:strand:- start:1647 stop:3098 length:1452 start_codon:yes stop_codon:yes gene_type:complete
MATIISNTQHLASETVAAIDATIDGSTYTISGAVGQTFRLFTKTFTTTTNYIFEQDPTVDFSQTDFPENYSFTVEDTGSISGGNFTVRKYTIFYTMPSESSSGDIITFNAFANIKRGTSTGKIRNIKIDSSDLPYYGERRKVNVYGDPSATATLRAQITSGTDLTQTTAVVSANESGSTTVTLANSNIGIFKGMAVSGTNIAGGTTVSNISGTTLTLSAGSSGGAASGTLTFSNAFTIEIGSDGVYELELDFPAITSSTSYTITLTQIAGSSFIEELNGLSSKAIVIQQRAKTVVTVALSQSASTFTLPTPSSVTLPGLADRTNNFVTSSSRFEFIINAASAGEISKDGTFAIADFTSSSTSANVATLANSNQITLTDFDIQINNQTTQAVGSASSTVNIPLSAANSAIAVGMTVTGTNVAGSTTVAAISGKNLTLSTTPTGSVSGTLSFRPMAVISFFARVNFHGTGAATTTLNVDNILNFA